MSKSGTWSNVRTRFKATLANRDLWALGLILVIVLVFFHEIFDGKIIWGADIEYFFYPTRAALADALRRGDISSILWSPYIFGGYPLFAEGQIGALYPLNWLFALPFPSLLTMYTIQTVSHYFLAGAFTYAYARSMRMRRAGALLAAIGFSFCGFMVAHIYHLSLINAAVWLPLLLLFTERLLTTCRTAERWRALLGASVALSLMIFAGHPQVALMSILVLGGYILFHVLWDKDVPGVQWKAHRVTLSSPIVTFLRKPIWAIAVFSLVTAIGVLAAAAQLLPLLELTQFSVRSGATISYEHAVEYALPVENLQTLIFPFRFGDLKTYRGAYNFAELALYIGVLPLALAILALFQKPNRYTIFFFLVVTLGLMLALGDATPLFGLLHRLPIYSGFRAPARFVLLVDFAIAILAGFGLSRLYPTSASDRKRLLSVVILLSVLSGVTLSMPVAQMMRLWFAAKPSAMLADSGGSSGPYTVFLPLIAYSRQSRISAFISSVWSKLHSYDHLPYLFILGSVMLLLLPLALGSRKRWMNWVYVFCIALVAVDLFLFMERLNDAFLFSFQSTHDYLREADAMVDCIQKQAFKVPRIYNVRGHPSNFLLPQKIASLDGYTPLMFARHNRYKIAVAEGNLSLLSLASVDYIIDYTDRYADLLAQNGHSLVCEAQIAKVYETIGALPLPRAFVVFDAFDATITGENPLTILMQRDLDLTKTVILENADDATQLMGSGEAMVEIVDDTAARVALRTSSTRSGFLVLNDSYYAGWKAFVDGEAREIYRANDLFRAIHLPPGEHSVEFVYRPLSVYVGVAISVLTLTAAAGYVIIAGVCVRVERRVEREKDER